MNISPHAYTNKCVTITLRYSLKKMFGTENMIYKLITDSTMNEFTCLDRCGQVRSKNRFFQNRWEGGLYGQFS